MFQTFTATSTPDQGPKRLAALREVMKDRALDGFLVPRADVHQGEYVAPRDERLSWLTGFTGSAGFAAILPDIAGVFIDGRYRVQVKAQVAADFTPVPWPETKLADWLNTHAPDATIAFDPKLHSVDEIEGLMAAFKGTLQPSENLVDAIWDDQPGPPMEPAIAYPIEFAGEKSGDKRTRLARALADAGQSAAILTLPDSINWLLNIRGGDIPRIPVMHAFAILHADASVDLFCAPEKVAELGPDPAIRAHPQDTFWGHLQTLTGTVRIDPSSAPMAVLAALTTDVARDMDPCVLPKAQKNLTEIDGMRAAHNRDAVAMVEFLAWLDAQPPGSITEIDVVKALEGHRRASNLLQDISFETISGAGGNGAIVHYRVTEETNATVEPGLLLVDSGGQYLDGTTDITRTVAVGEPTEEQRRCFTLVLKGMIGLSMARFPKGIAGRDLDALARIALWREGMDYDHGTGHGVGAYLSVHEGPARIARVSTLPLAPGMILSNEPGYYREGEFGIRIENLIVVEPPETSADGRAMLGFETLTFVPIDRRLIDPTLLSPDERAWLNAYHGQVAERLEGHLSEQADAWLQVAVAEI